MIRAMVARTARTSENFVTVTVTGDESAMPAVLAILDNAPDTLHADVYLEVPHSDDFRELSTPPNVKVHWLARNGSGDIPGRLALETVKSATLPDELDYTWVAGESGLATGVRRFLVQERKIPKSTVTFLGYWRHGKASPRQELGLHLSAFTAAAPKTGSAVSNDPSGLVVSLTAA
ncbi:siderophore-interacting protein [Kibdelosporangium philippinense]|uniref:Siderophore-interacting protein n=1 Tax=Kibdelosporangium philippinense TaxID=211113 RepID=A0ABS8ZRN5_9PSEU|nr:siderophore-interacting protein [Kibdelosporangium philippinense]MCE7010379.1 siderophore-interacting protein [Kibdelosporangium philippinense]